VLLIKVERKRERPKQAQAKRSDRFEVAFDSRSELGQIRPLVGTMKRRF
jgi:hypothetical protein